MPVIQYPFIDIAVHERVRERFAAGDAMVLFSSDMSMPLWANGQGANLFGHQSVYDFLDQGPGAQNVAFRQIEGTGRRLQALGDTGKVAIRIPSGFRRIVVNASCERIEIGGAPVILFAAHVGSGEISQSDCAARMIEGLDDPDTHMAVLDDNGRVIAASAAFDELALTPQTTRMLVTMAGSDPGRLVKRPISTAKGYLPTATGKLSDAPALHLLLVVEAHPPGMDIAPAPDEDEAPQLQAQPAGPLHDGGDFNTAIDAVAKIEEPIEQEEAISLELAETGNDTEAEAEPGNAADAAGNNHAPTADTPTSELAPMEGEDDGRPALFEFSRAARATRFVWKIDAEGRFSEVSDEFARTVGPQAANISGMAFSDIAARFHLDPDGKISDLLGKRDTWSGRTIWWPVEDTSLIVPIDLAALPTYTRNREFDGFRGFGIVRIGDAVEDPHATGLTLTPPSIAPIGESPVQEAAAPEEADSLPPTSIEREEAHRPEAEDGTAADEQTAEPALDWPEGERPALRIVEGPGQRHSNKIVHLEPRRPRRDGLSPVEQAAFREIARQLDSFVERASDETGAEDDTAPETASPDEPREFIEKEHDPQEFVGEDASNDNAEKAATGTIVSGGDDDAAAEAEEPSKDGADEESQPADPLLPLRERSELSAEILDQMPVALLVHSGDRLIHANPEFLGLTGYASVEALAEMGGLDALLQRQDLENKTDHAGGMVIVRADDAVIPVTARLKSVRYDQASALMLALMPAASQKDDEEEAPQDEDAEIIELAESRLPNRTARLHVEVEELRAILETATDGVVIIDADGRIRSMNRAASALFNYDNEETAGKPFVVLFAHESQKAIVDYLGGLSGHGVASVLNDGREVIGREASGGFLPLFMTIGRLTSSNGYCAVIRDITQWKRTEEELRTAKRSAETANAHKSEFLAHVSHEIRTPLNAIIGFADLMSSEHFGPVGHPRYIEYANDIVRSGRHVLDIVNDLLDISKIEAGEMELDFGAVELNESISEAVSLVQPQANNQRVIIRTALSHAVPPVVADLRSIKQIVLNILSNAIRFTPSGGQIVVSTVYEANGSVILRIRDTGIGMTRPELELAMKPFRQVAGSVRNRGDGTGLGLPLTKAMVDANRAAFSISSTPNEGTLVEITFPSPRVLAD